MPRHRPDLQGSAREMAELNAEFWRICTVGMLVECAYLLFALMRGRELKCVDAIYYGVLGSPSCEGGS